MYVATDERVIDSEATLPPMGCSNPPQSIAAYYKMNIKMAQYPVKQKSIPLLRLMDLELHDMSRGPMFTYADTLVLDLTSFHLLGILFPAALAVYTPLYRSKLLLNQS